MAENPLNRIAEHSHKEVLGQEYPPQVVERWKTGGKRWREFDAQITMLGLRGELTDSSRDALRSVFVGIKPAVFLDSGDKLKRIRPIMEAAGIAMTHGRRLLDVDYLYDPSHVEKVLRDNPDIFPEKPEALTANLVMEALAREPGGESARRRGLMLGFPRAAVEAFEARRGVGGLVGERFYDALSAEDRAVYEKMFAEIRPEYSAREKSVWLRQKLSEYDTLAGITPEKKAEIELHLDRETSWQSFGAHGFTWCDFAASKESADKERHIKDAFLVAGIT